MPWRRWRRYVGLTPVDIWVKKSRFVLLWLAPLFFRRFFTKMFWPWESRFWFGFDIVTSEVTVIWEESVSSAKLSGLKFRERSVANFSNSRTILDTVATLGLRAMSLPAAILVGEVGGVVTIWGIKSCDVELRFRYLSSALLKFGDPATVIEIFFLLIILLKMFKRRVGMV